jgi:hypothetical protein
MIADRPAPTRVLGGTVLQVSYYGTNREFAEIWTVHPDTLREEAIFVHATPGDMPVRGDHVYWHPGHSPGWAPKFDANQRRRYLPRIGASFDPNCSKARKRAMDL